VAVRHGTDAGDEQEAAEFEFGTKALTVSESDAPWGVEGSSKFHMKNDAGEEGNWYGFQIRFADLDEDGELRQFTVWKSYAVVFEMKKIADNTKDDEGTAKPVEWMWAQLNNTDSFSQKTPVPAVGEVATVTVVFDRGPGSEVVNFFAKPCDWTVAVGNIRITEMVAGGNQTLPQSRIEAAVAGDAAEIRAIEGRKRHYGKGTLPTAGSEQNTFVFSGVGRDGNNKATGEKRDDADDYIGWDGKFAEDLPARSYTFTMDFRLFRYFGCSELVIDIGKGGHLEKVDLTKYTAFETKRVSFTFTLQSATPFISMYLNTEYKEYDNYTGTREMTGIAYLISDVAVAPASLATD
jgi:hypothetical protein